MFWDNLLVPFFKDQALKMGLIGYPEMSVRKTTTHCTITQMRTVLICFTVEARKHEYWQRLG